MKARLEAMLKLRCLKVIPNERGLLCYRFAIIREVMQAGSHFGSHVGSHVRNHVGFRPS